MITHTEYKEEQRFAQWLLWILLLSAGALPAMGIYQQIVKGVPFGNNPMSDLGLVLFAVFMLAIIAMFMLVRLKTTINSEAISISFGPFIRKRFEWSEIVSAEVVNYGFVGGWGIRFGTRYGTVYNTNGNKGLAIALKNGQKHCIGTQNSAELQQFVDEVLKHRN